MNTTFDSDYWKKQIKATDEGDFKFSCGHGNPSPNAKYVAAWCELCEGDLPAPARRIHAQRRSKAEQEQAVAPAVCSQCGGKLDHNVDGNNKVCLGCSTTNEASAFAVQKVVQ